MLSQALFITLIGMGGVFAFLILLILVINILHFCLSKTNASKTDKIAVAIAAALNQE